MHTPCYRQVKSPESEFRERGTPEFDNRPREPPPPAPPKRPPSPPTPPTKGYRSLLYYLLYSFVVMYNNRIYVAK